MSVHVELDGECVLGIVVRVLGPVGLAVDDVEVSVGGPRAQAVLGLVAMRADEVVTLDWMVEQLWPGRPPRTARATVQSYVSRLRSAAGPGGRQALRGRSTGYLLDASVADVDVRAFERHSLRGREHGAAGRWSEALDELRSALTLYRGTPYTGVDEVEALAADRRRLDELHRETQLAHWSAVLNTGRPDDVIEPLHRFTDERQWDERGWRLLMLALYRAGRQTEALQAGVRARTLLVDEHGLDPSPPLAALEQQILNHDPALAGVAARPRTPDWLRPITEEVAGRRAEWAVLLREWTACRDTRRARLVLVRGEPGVGKSCLVAAFAAEVARRGGRVLAGRCLDAPRLPLQPWPEIVGPLSTADESGRHADPVTSLVDVWEITAHRLFDAVAQRCQDKVRAGPTLIVAEDLHWAGVAALRLVEHVLQAGAQSPMLVVATVRSSAADAEAAAKAALGELTARHHPTLVDLHGLAAEALAQVVASHGYPIDTEAAQTLWERTGGVPLLALEAVRGGTGMVDARLARLGVAASAAVELLAVAGNGAPLAVLVAASGDEASTVSAFDELDAAGLVRWRSEVPVSVEFHHDLYREAVAQRLSPPRRMLLARRLVSAADQHPTLVTPVAVAAYALAAATSGVPADVVRAGEECRRAAAVATAVHDHDEALVWLRRAREQAARLGLDAPELDLEFGIAARMAGHDGARTAFLAAADAARRRGAAALLADIGVGWSRGFFARAGAVDEDLVAVLREALAHPSSLSDGLRAKAMAALAAELTWAAGGDERFGLAEEAIALARADGDPATLGYVLRAHQLTIAAADTLAARRRATDELLVVADQLDDIGLRFEALFHRCGPAIEYGELRLIDASLEEAARVAEALRQPALQWSVGWSRASLQLWRGSLAEAEKLAQEAAQVGMAADQPEALVFLGAQLVEIRRLQGRLHEVAPMLPSTPAGAADGFSTARYLLTVGRPNVVRSALPDGRSLRLRRDLLERPSLDNLAYCAAGLGLTELGAAVASALGPLADTFGHTVVAHPVGHHWLGVLALSAGRPHDAVRHLRHAVARHRRCGLPLMTAESAVALGQALAAVGDDPGAAEMNALARDLSAAHGAPGVLTPLVSRQPE